MKLFHITHPVLLPLLRVKGIRPNATGTITVLLSEDRERIDFEAKNNLFYRDYVVVEFDKANHSLLHDCYMDVRRELQLENGCTSIKDFEVCFTGHVTLATAEEIFEFFRSEEPHLDEDEIRKNATGTWKQNESIFDGKSRELEDLVKTELKGGSM